MRNAKTISGHAKIGRIVGVREMKMCKMLSRESMSSSLILHSTDEETKRIKINTYNDVKKEMGIVISKNKGEANKAFDKQMNDDLKSCFGKK